MSCPFSDRDPNTNMPINLNNDPSSHDLSRDRQESSIPRTFTHEIPTTTATLSPSHCQSSNSTSIKNDNLPFNDKSIGNVNNETGIGKTSKWNYPSPLMFYNALKRKGYSDTKPEEIDSMLYIHNNLNEQVWKEICKWESEFYGHYCPFPTLEKFRGRPGELTPKAWFYSKIYRGNPPFDRHDWTVNRCGKKIRYIIDYYDGGIEDGMPVFYCDVRPALDSPMALWDRIRMAYKRFAASPDPPFKNSSD